MYSIPLHIKETSKLPYNSYYFFLTHLYLIYTCSNLYLYSDKQMWVAAVPVGATGKQLNSTFHCRDTTAYKVMLLLCSTYSSLCMYCLLIVYHDSYYIYVKYPFMYAFIHSFQHHRIYQHVTITITPSFLTRRN